jgi:hypothetical protein
MDADKVLSLDDIVNLDDAIHAEVKAFGGIVNLASLGADLIAEYLEIRSAPEFEGKRNVMLAAYSMLSPAQRELPREQRIAFVTAATIKLKKKNIDSLNVVTQKALEINGFRPEAKEERKNDSSETPGGGSLIESPSQLAT